MNERNYKIYTRKISNTTEAEEFFFAESSIKHKTNNMEV